MISPEYVLTMARYNAWQNRQMKVAVEPLPSAALTEDRGAFFGSILGTLNHLLWGDATWMARFDGGEKPAGGIPESTDLMPSLSEWAVARFRIDARILHWAESLRAVDLAGDLRWYSGAVGAEVARPMALCITHMFNHQTHHRGQLHAMATAAGAEGWTSDLAFMSEEGPWL
ncbi:DinB family protein [Marimonas arenosa]|uniref:DinB family protein n=1 Tax=Marimonas arenosa TaxID=1795305 RepID=A0AAE4B432_9RHOB|nr:DinB family protein [Marimonas arenosa]MDQ2088999.1 DinB family protein [Marimonas arenosa]